MSVRNITKGLLANNEKYKGPTRSANAPQFSFFEGNQTPMKGSRKLKPGYIRPKPKAPGELSKGLAKRPHTSPNSRKLSFKGHCVEENMARWVPLTKARKAK